METLKTEDPGKYRKVMYWGMKVSPEEKEAIKFLSKAFKRPASQIILEFVHNALLDLKHQEPVIRKKLSIDELMSLPKSEREKIVKKQTKKIVKEYEKDIFQYNEDIIET